MRVFLTAAVFVAFAFGFASAAVAQDFDASAVLNFFDPPRVVCVGTVEECQERMRVSRENIALKEAGHGFNMLVNFDFNSDVLTAGAMANLQQVAIAINDPRLMPYRFSVEGHTDATGTETYNTGLSNRRAESVKLYLTKLGVDTSRLLPIGWGEAKPFDPADPMAAANRRVELKIVTQ